MKKNMGKKGIVDIVFIGAFLFVFAIFIWFAQDLFSEVADGVGQVESINNSNHNEALNRMSSIWVGLGNGMWLILFVGFVLVALIGAFQINTHPLFAIVAFIVFVILLVVAGSIQNAYIDASNTTEFSSRADDYPGIDNVMSNLIVYLIGIGVMIGIVLYSRIRGEK